MSIKLRFVTGNSTVSSWIRAAEFGFIATHVEAVIPPEGVLNGTLSRMPGGYLGSVAPQGVFVRPVGYDAGFTWEAFVDVPATNQQVEEFFKVGSLQIGKGYDEVDLMSDFVGGRNWRDPNKWWCSELMAYMLEEVNLIGNIVLPVQKISPRDLALILSSVGFGFDPAKWGELHTVPK